MKDLRQKGIMLAIMMAAGTAANGAELNDDGSANPYAPTVFTQNLRENVAANNHWPALERLHSLFNECIEWAGIQSEKIGHIFSKYNEMQELQDHLSDVSLAVHERASLNQQQEYARRAEAQNSNAFYDIPWIQTESSHSKSMNTDTPDVHQQLDALKQQDRQEWEKLFGGVIERSIKERKYPTVNKAKAYLSALHDKEVARDLMIITERLSVDPELESDNWSSSQQEDAAYIRQHTKNLDDYGDLTGIDHIAINGEIIDTKDLALQKTPKTSQLELDQMNYLAAYHVNERSVDPELESNNWPSKQQEDAANYRTLSRQPTLHNFIKTWMNKPHKRTEILLNISQWMYQKKYRIALAMALAGGSLQVLVRHKDALAEKAHSLYRATFRQIKKTGTAIVRSIKGGNSTPETQGS